MTTPRFIYGASAAILALLIAASALSAAADDTRHSRSRMHSLLERPSAPSPAIVPDTLRLPSRDSISLAGYDKPLRTTHETLLVTNSTTRKLTGLCITVTYLDMQGRQLHRRTDTLTVSIPPAETRLLRFPSWDRQQSYYYHLGPAPRSSRFTPYTVSILTDFTLHTP